MAPSRYRRPALSTAYPRKQSSPRRALKLVAIGITVLFIFLLLTSSPVPAATVAKFPALRPTAHQPPAQPNSTSGDAKWYSDWKWHNPFSFAITQDETRSVLPPLRPRPPIYAFYDAGASGKDRPTRAAEAKLLLVWRRAWWAQGFKPMILGRAEAMNNPLYETLQGKSMEKSLETEFLRWMAWGTMGTGILANWLVLPMAVYDDHLLSYLRRGEYPKLTRYEGLRAGFFSGEKSSINGALGEALKSRKLQTVTTILDAIPANTFAVDPKPDALAFYQSATLAELYKPLVATIAEDKPAGLLALGHLITSHLHLTFLNSFRAGIAILTPYEPLSSLLALPAAQVAHALNTCPSTPIPSSCPPNNQKCGPCSPVPITTPESHSNSSSLYTIGTIPHPYTLTSLLVRSKDVTVRQIRRDMDRDPWLHIVTEKTLGKQLGGPSRIVPFKETVASEWGFARGLWMTEDGTPSRRDLAWRFGFALSGHNASSSPSSPSLAMPEKHSRAQHELLAAALEVVRKNDAGPANGIRDAVEAWNMADTEAWRFVRAFAAREVVERRRWEEEERRFAGGKEEEEEELGEEGGRRDGEGGWK